MVLAHGFQTLSEETKGKKRLAESKAMTQERMLPSRKTLRKMPPMLSTNLSRETLPKSNKNEPRVVRSLSLIPEVIAFLEEVNPSEI